MLYLTAAFLSSALNTHTYVCVSTTPAAWCRYVSGHSPLDFSELRLQCVHDASCHKDSGRVEVDVVTLAAGDVLYMPPDWYHQVESGADGVTGRSVAVNFWSERLFGWSVDDDPNRANRMSKILDRHPDPPSPAPTVPWESFMD